jgi:hypothetical protein
MNECYQSDDNIFTRMFNFFSNDVNLYVLENDIMIPIKKLKYIEKYNGNKYYITIKISNNCQKYLVFNDKTVLKNCYDSIKNTIFDKLPKFSTYMEVINKTNNKDVLEIFNCYDDHSQTFFNDVTKYNLKSNDLYDFKNSCFVADINDTIEVTKMNLDIKIVEPGQEIIGSLII